MKAQSFSLHLNSAHEGKGRDACFDLHDLTVRSKPENRPLRVLTFIDRNGAEAVLFFPDANTWERFRAVIDDSEPFPVGGDA